MCVCACVYLTTDNKVETINIFLAQQNTQIHLATRVERKPPKKRKKTSHQKKTKKKKKAKMTKWVVLWLRWWFHWRHITHAKQTAIYWWVYCNHLREEFREKKAGGKIADWRLLADARWCCLCRRIATIIIASVDSWLFVFSYSFWRLGDDTICKFRFMTTRAT